MKIMNLGDVQGANGVAAVLQNSDDDAVDPHLERIKNEAGGEESDEEVPSSVTYFTSLVLLQMNHGTAVLFSPFNAG